MGTGSSTRRLQQQAGHAATANSILDPSHRMGTTEGDGPAFGARDVKQVPAHGSSK